MQVKTIQEAAAALDPLIPERRRKPRHFAQGGTLWFAALLLLLSYAAFIAFAYMGCRLFLLEDKNMGVWALACLGSCVLLRLWAVWYTHRLRCPLCHGTVLQEKRCLKHSEAGKWPLISYTASVAFQVLLTWRFHCMYCGMNYQLRR
jgi:hypothetical protein